MPKTPRIPAQVRPPDWLPAPPTPHKLNKRQSDEFYEADRALHKLLDELDALEKLPDGGDEARRKEILAEVKAHTNVLTRSAELLSLKLATSVEEDNAKMNRADRRRIEAQLRKRKNARARASADAAARKG